MPSSSCFYLYTENLSLLVLLPIFAYKKDTCQNLPVSLLHFFKISYPYSIKVIAISSVFTSFPYMTWKQWQPADLVKLSDFSPFWLCVPVFQQVCPMNKYELLTMHIEYHTFHNLSIIFNNT
mgnify:CR=1 FL=1